MSSSEDKLSEDTSSGEEGNGGSKQEVPEVTLSPPDGYLSDTPTQFYLRLLVNRSQKEVLEILGLLAFMETAIKKISELLSTINATRHREKQLATGIGITEVHDKDYISATSSSLLSQIENIVIAELLSSKIIRAILSQNKRQLIQREEATRCGGGYIAYLQPLDSPENALAGYISGTTFAFVKLPEGNGKERKLKAADVIFPLTSIILAGFASFGYRTELTLTLPQHGVQKFILDSELGLFVAYRKNLKVPRKARFYSGDGANSSKWPHQIRAYLDLADIPQYFWPGGFISQLSAVLEMGGIFLAPLTLELDEQIPVFSVAYPIGLLMSEGGGSCFPLNHGLREEDLFQLRPSDPFQMTGLCFGSSGSIDFLKAIYREEIPLNIKYFIYQLLHYYYYHNTLKGVFHTPCWFRLRVRHVNID